LTQPAVEAGIMAGRAQPRILADRLVLRPFAPDDVDRLIEAYQDPAIRRWHARTMDRAEAVEFVAKAAVGWATETSAQWAMTNGHNRFVGRIGLRTVILDEGVAEISYWVMSSARGHGFAPDALRGLTAWCFDDLGLHRLELLHSTFNESSCRVATKSGFALEGTKRGATLHDDGWHDMHLHAIIAS
jgi:RimJ/RimL family protein N-acetyltransferase